MKATLFLVLLLCLSLYSATARKKDIFHSRRCGYGYKCYGYHRISTSVDYAYEVRIYPETLWVTMKEDQEMTSMRDYLFLVDYASRNLAKYYEGENYVGEQLNRTTPMRIDINPLKLHAPRSVSFPVRVDEQDSVPAPFHPLFVDKMARKPFYVRRVPTNISYRDLLHTISDFMADLTLNNEPFRKDTVCYMIYTKPENFSVESNAKRLMANEIWIERTPELGGGYEQDRNPLTGKYVLSNGDGIGGVSGGSIGRLGGGDRHVAIGFSDESRRDGYWYSHWPGNGYRNGRAHVGGSLFQDKSAEETMNHHPDILQDLFTNDYDAQKQSDNDQQPVQ